MNNYKIQHNVDRQLKMVTQQGRRTSNYTQLNKLWPQNDDILQDYRIASPFGKSFTGGQLKTTKLSKVSKPKAPIESQLRTTKSIIKS